QAPGERRAPLAAAELREIVAYRAHHGAEIAEQQEQQQDDEGAEREDIERRLGLVVGAAGRAGLLEAADRRAAAAAGPVHPEPRTRGERLSCISNSRRRCRGRSPPGG